MLMNIPILALCAASALVQTSRAASFTDVFGFLSAVLGDATGINGLVATAPLSNVRLWSQEGNQAGAENGGSPLGDYYGIKRNSIGLTNVNNWATLHADQYWYQDVSLNQNPYAVWLNTATESCLAQIRILYNSNDGTQDGHFSALLLGNNFQACGYTWGSSQTVVNVNGNDMISNCGWFSGTHGQFPNSIGHLKVDLNAFSNYAKKNWNNCGILGYHPASSCCMKRGRKPP